MRLDHSAQLGEIDIHPGRFWVRDLSTCWGLLHTEAVSTVAGEIEPSQGRDFESSFRTAMAAVPEAIEAIGVWTWPHHCVHIWEALPPHLSGLKLGLETRQLSVPRRLTLSVHAS